jgi:hypothetical protein
MLRNNDLFLLIKTLNIHEKRYLTTVSKKAGDQQSAYGRMIELIYRMDTYDEQTLKSAFSSFSRSNKLDVKKHYLYYWIIKHLADFNASSYITQNDIRNIQVLLDRSLVTQAEQLISDIKTRVIKSENYLELLSLLEKELILQKYNNERNSQLIIEELIYYSNKYSTQQSFESAKEKFRNILDQNMFSRTEAQQKQIEELFKDKILRKNTYSNSFLLSVQYNTLYYWKFGSENDWAKAHKYALKNYKLILENLEKFKLFPEIFIQILYNYLNATSIAGKGGYVSASKKLSELIVLQDKKRFKQDGLFYLNLSKLIHLNRNRTSHSGPKVVLEAEHFIELNKESFSVFRLNNFYFDLAKSYFYLNDYRKAFKIFNEIYQKFYTKDYTVDFYTHSRILYCLTCFEIGEIDLMISTANSVTEFMKRNAVFFSFEKKILRFILRELPTIQEKSKQERIKKIEKLRAELESIFESDYERKVLNYFDYYHWIDTKMERSFD